MGKPGGYLAEKVFLFVHIGFVGVHLGQGQQRGFFGTNGGFFGTKRGVFLYKVGGFWYSPNEALPGKSCKVERVITTPQSRRLEEQLTHTHTVTHTAMLAWCWEQGTTASVQEGLCLRGDAKASATRFSWFHFQHPNSNSNPNSA